MLQAGHVAGNQFGVELSQFMFEVPQRTDALKAWQLICGCYAVLRLVCTPDMHAGLARRP